MRNGRQGKPRQLQLKCARYLADSLYIYGQGLGVDPSIIHQHFASPNAMDTLSALPPVVILLRTTLILHTS